MSFSWSDPAAWPDGKVPGPNDMAVIDREIVLDRDVIVCGMRTVADVGNLIFDPASSCKLSVCCNIMNEGAITMHPRASSSHEILFTGIDESKFVGGGDVMLDTDVGLWVMGDGVLDAQGTDRVGWVSNAEFWDASWQSQDDVRLAPIAPGDFTSFRSSLDPNAPRYADYDGVLRYAEAFSLTRNVIIGGTGDGSADPKRNGRAHVMFMMTRKPQTIRNVLLRNVGPRAGTVGSTTSVLGRWGLHFHRCGDTSRGSLVENVVVQNCGSHSFVAHASHGITFKRCVSFNSWESAYWWDPDTKDPKTGKLTLNQSDDITYDHCMAAMVRSDPPGRGYRSAGFELGFGQRNAAVGCVAVGVQGNLNASGFYWQEAGDLRPFVTNPRQYATPWGFVGCVSHNNKQDGAFIWQNKQSMDMVDGFVAFRNGRAGVEHGAYANTFKFQHCYLYENGMAGVMLAAMSHPDADPTNRLRFSGCTIDGGTAVPVLSLGHFVLDAFPYAIFEDCAFRSSGQIAIDVEEPATSSPGKVAFLRCKFNDAPLASGHIRLNAAPGSSYVIDSGATLSQPIELTAHRLPVGWVP